MGTSGILEDFVSSRWKDLNLNYKCFGIHMLIVFVCTATTQKKLRRKVKLHKMSHRTQKWTGQNDWHLIKIVINNWFSSMWCSCNLYLDTPVASNRCGQYSNHTCHQLKWRKVDSFQCVTLSMEKKKWKSCLWIWETKLWKNMDNLKATSPSPEILMFLRYLQPMHWIFFYMHIL